MNCFNFAQQIWAPTASIKHHCSRRNLHSFSPGLEERLKVLEDKADEVLKFVRRGRMLPPLGTVGREWLLAYLAFQKSRTPSAMRHVTVFRDYFRELLGDAIPGPETDVHPLALTLSVAKDVVPLTLDLEMHLLLNETNIEFITSDDPVVIHNQYCEGIAYQGVLGWSCTGLQVFFPISPTELLMLFDRDVYRVGRSHRGESTTIVSDPRDVEMVNSLQIHNAEDNVYFAGQRGAQAIVQQCHVVSAKRRTSRFTFIETERVKETPTREAAIIGHHENLLPVQLAATVIAIRKAAKRVPLAARASYRRGQRKARQTQRSGAAPQTKRYPFKTITRMK